MSILNSDDSQRGYHDGYEAGISGKEKNFVRSGMSWKFALHGSPAIDSYNAGYNKGYAKGCYDRNSKGKPQTVRIETGKQTNNNTFHEKPNIMSEGQVIRKQIRQLKQFRSFLEVFKDELDNKRIRLKKEVSQCQGLGLPDEIAGYIRMNLGAKVAKSMRSLIEDIDETHIPKMEGAIEHLEEILTIITGDDDYDDDDYDDDDDDDDDYID